MKHWLSLESVPVKHFKLFVKYATTLPEGLKEVSDKQNNLNFMCVQRMLEEAQQVIEDQSQVKFDDIENLAIQECKAESGTEASAKLHAQILSTKVKRAAMIAEGMSAQE